MTTATILERRIALAGASNFRDLGGYPTEDGRMTRWQRVFRSDAVHDLTDDDVGRVVALGVGDVFDLRTGRELEAFGTGRLAARGARHHHVPFIVDAGGATGAAVRRMIDPGDHQDHAEAYLDLLEQARPSVYRVLDHLAAASPGAMLFHCTGGRDRTGLVAALLLSVLGVPRRIVAADYALTAEYLAFSDRRMSQLRSMYGDPGWAGVPPTHAEVMLLTLSGLDERYGSPETYLRSTGIAGDHQEALRRTLLEC